MARGGTSSFGLSFWTGLTGLTGLTGWHNKKIRAWDEWDRTISYNLNSAEVILFLVSPHFLASAYCRDVEGMRTKARYHKGNATVIPIILKQQFFGQRVRSLGGF